MIIGSIIAVKIVDSVINFFFIKLRDFLEHGVKPAGAFADGNHLANQRRKNFTVPQWLGHGLTLTDAYPALHDRFFNDFIAGGSGGDRQTIQDRHSGTQ